MFGGKKHLSPYFVGNQIYVLLLGPCVFIYLSIYKYIMSKTTF